MAPTRKYQINAQNRFCCPNCDKTFKSQASCCNHWRKEHKTQTVTIDIPDTTPLRKAKMTAPSQSVSRAEFDELKAQYQTIIEQNQTIIEMLKNLTTVSAPVVEPIEIVEESIKVEEPVEEIIEPIKVEEPIVEVAQPITQVKKQPKAKAPKPPKKTAEEIYNENMNALRSHPYFSHTTEDGIDMFKFGDKLYKEPHHVIQAYERYYNYVESGHLWAGAVMSNQMTQKQLEEKQKEAKKEINENKDTYNTFLEAYRRLQNIKGKPKKKQTNKKAKQVKEVELVEQEEQEEVIEEPTEEPIQEVSKASDNEEFKKQSKEFLIECCRTLYDGGFAKAYHHLNDHDNWHIMKVVNVKTWTDDVMRPITKKDKDGNDLRDAFGGYEYVTTKKGELKYETVKETFTREDIDYKVLVKPNAKTEKDKYRKVRLCDIRDHMENIYKTLFETWTDYRLSKGEDFDEEDVFDDDPTQDTWLSISQDLVNTDNLQDFFWDNNSQ